MPHDGDPDLGLGLWSEEDDFPPRRLLGPASDSTAQPTFAAAATSRRGGGVGRGGEDGWQEIHPVVARRGLDFLWYLCKASFRVTHDMLTVGPAGGEGELGAPGGSGGGKGGAMVVGVGSPVAEAKGSSGKGKGKGRRGGAGKGKGKLVEAMDVAGVCVGVLVALLRLLLSQDSLRACYMVVA